MKSGPVGRENVSYQNVQNAMATEKLAEGIRGFSNDIEKLEKIILQKLVA